MQSQEIIERLAQGLNQPLPGQEAQFRMAPVGRPNPGKEFSIPSDARRSAVLMLLYPHREDIFMPLILRPEYGGVHSRQIGLPGGKVEPEDQNLLDTALREAQEEIGIDRRRVEILGELSMMYIPPSNFLVQPFVGVLDFRPKFIPQPTEVDELIETPISEFWQTENQGLHQISAGGFDRRDIPAFTIQGHVVWGATAMMMSEFIAVLGKKPQLH